MYGKVDTNTFTRGIKETKIVSARKADLCATNNIIQSVSNVRSYDR